MYLPSVGTRLFRGAAVEPDFREKHDFNSKSMQDNTEWPSENLSKIPSQSTPQSSELYESKVKDTAAPCKKVPHNTPHDVPHGVDDLPLGVEANTLNEIPASKLNEMSPSKPNETTASTINETPVNNLNKMTLSSTSDENESKPFENSTDVAGEKPASKDTTQLVINPQDKTQQWLHTLTGRQHSFGSDLSAGTNSSSIDILLQSREANPEEILRSLGFGSSQNDEVKARIPQRFFSDSKFCIDDFKQRSELQELFDSWKSEKNSSGQFLNPVHVSETIQFFSVNEVPSRYMQPSSLTMRSIMGAQKKIEEEKEKQQQQQQQQKPSEDKTQNAEKAALSCKLEENQKSPKKFVKPSDVNKRILEETKASVKHSTNKSHSPYHSPIRNPLLSDLTLNEEAFDDVSWSSESSIAITSYMNIRLAPNETLV
uniref:ITPR-interacting domain-containing protein n=1 Tax=Octopus bimaculoides TaxID=37653 RepID=A0A0L8FWZ0_OCTBM